MQNLLQNIAKRVSLNPTLIEQIELNFEPITVKRGERILSEHQRARYLYFVEKGVLHNYYYHKERQITSWFYAENAFVTAWHSFYMQQASYEEIKCLEDSVLYRISYTNYQKLIIDSTEQVIEQNYRTR